MQHKLFVAVLAAVIAGSPTSAGGPEHGRGLASQEELLHCVFAGKHVSVIYTSERLKFVNGPSVPIILAEHKPNGVQFEARSPVYSVRGEIGQRSWIEFGEVGSTPQKMFCTKDAVPILNVSVSTTNRA